MQDEAPSVAVIDSVDDRVSNIFPGRAGSLLSRFKKPSSCLPETRKFRDQRVPDFLIQKKVFPIWKSLWPVAAIL
jgi:hypothetical protein